MNHTKMNKAACLLAAGMMMLLMAGCGAKQQAPAPSQAAETTAAATKAPETTAAAQAAETTAAAQAAETTAAATEEAGKYSVKVEDESGAPVAGVTIQFCTDSLCMTGKTDAEGIASFAQAPGSYTVHVLRVPDGYAEDPAEYSTPEKPGTVNIVLKAAETEAETAAAAGEETQAEETGGEADGGEVFEPLKIGDQVFYESSDLEGNPLRSTAVFSEAKVTMVNLWATWCYYCVEELPELAKLAKEFEAQDCQIIGICTDANNPETAAEAIALLEDAGAEYLNLWGEDYVFDVFPVTCLPTTVFVDKDGNILTDPVEGANLNGYREALKEALKRVE